MPFQDRLITEIQLRVDRRELNAALQTLDNIAGRRQIEVAAVVRGLDEVRQVQAELARMSQGRFQLHVDTREIAAASNIVNRFGADVQALAGNLAGLQRANIGTGLVTNFQQARRELVQLRDELVVFQDRLAQSQASGAPRRVIQSQQTAVNRAERAVEQQVEELQRQAQTLQTRFNQTPTGSAAPTLNALLTTIERAQRLANSRSGGFANDAEISDVARNLANEERRPALQRRQRQREIAALTDFSGDKEIADVENRIGRIKQRIAADAERVLEAKNRFLTDVEIEVKDEMEQLALVLQDAGKSALGAARKRQAKLGTSAERIRRAQKDALALSSEELTHFHSEHLPRIAEERGVPLDVLKDRLQKPNFFDPRRLQNNESLVQLGFAAAFGGLPSLAGGLIGGSTPLGPSGALLGSTLAQGVREIILEKPFEAIKELEHEFREAGLGFQRSILGITSILQSNNALADGNGRLISDPQQALGFQQLQARNIQFAARNVLLPLGIAGQTESTFVQGITSALSQRGIQANPGQIANISRLIGGAIQAQRPSLLDNTQQLLKDLQDVIGGGPAATRTVLSQLVKPSLAGLQRAGSAAEIEAALKPLEAFAQAAAGLNNPVVVLNKLNGALDKLKTVGGEKLLDALTPAFERMFQVLDRPETEKAITGIATAIGDLSAIGIRLSARVIEVSTAFSGLLDPLKALAPAAIVAAAAFASLEAAVLASSKGTKSVTTSLLGSAGEALFGLPQLRDEKGDVTQFGKEGLLSRFGRAVIPGTGGQPGFIAGPNGTVPGTVGGQTLGGVAGAAGVGFSVGAIAAVALEVLTQFKEQETAARESRNESDTTATLAAIKKIQELTLPDAQIRATLKKIGLDENLGEFQSEFSKSSENRISSLSAQRKSIEERAAKGDLPGGGNLDQFFRNQTFPFFSKTIADETVKKVNEEVEGQVFKGTGVFGELDEIRLRKERNVEIVSARQQASADAEKSLRLLTSPEELEKQKKSLTELRNSQLKDVASKQVEFVKAQEEQQKLQTEIETQRTVGKFGGDTVGKFFAFPFEVLANLGANVTNAVSKGDASQLLKFETFQDGAEAEREQKLSEARNKVTRAQREVEANQKAVQETNKAIREAGKTPTDEIKNATEQFIKRKQEELHAVNEGYQLTVKETEAIKKRTELQLQVLDQTSAFGKSVAVTDRSAAIGERRELIREALTNAQGFKNTADGLNTTIEGIANIAPEGGIRDFIKKLLPRIPNAQPVLDFLGLQDRGLEREEFLNNSEASRLEGNNLRESILDVSTSGLGGRALATNVELQALDKDFAGNLNQRLVLQSRLQKLDPKDVEGVKQLQTEIAALDKERLQIVRKQTETEHSILDLRTQILSTQRDAISEGSAFGVNARADLAFQAAASDVDKKQSDFDKIRAKGDPIATAAAKAELDKSSKAANEAFSATLAKDLRKIEEEKRSIDGGTLGGRETLLGIDQRALTEAVSANEKDLAAKRELQKQGNNSLTVEADIQRLVQERRDLIRKQLEVERNNLDLIRAKLAAVLETLDQRSVLGKVEANKLSINAFNQIDGRLANSAATAETQAQKEDFERQRLANDVKRRQAIEDRDIFLPAEGIRSKGKGIDPFLFGSGTELSDIGREANSFEVGKLGQRIGALQKLKEAGTSSQQDDLELASLLDIQKAKKVEGAGLARDGINSRINDVTEAAGAIGFQDELEKSALDLSSRFHELEAAVKDTAHALEDFEKETRLRGLGAQGQRLAAADKLIKAGGSLADLDADTAALLSSPEARERFERDLAKEEFNSVARKTDRTRVLFDEEIPNRNRLQDAAAQSDFALKGFGAEEETTDIANASKSIQLFAKFRGTPFGDRFKGQAENALKLLKGKSDKFSNLTGKDIGFGKQRTALPGDGAFGGLGIFPTDEDDPFGDLDAFISTGKTKKERDAEGARLFGGPVEGVGKLPGAEGQFVPESGPAGALAGASKTGAPTTAKKDDNTQKTDHQILAEILTHLKEITDAKKDAKKGAKADKKSETAEDGTEKKEQTELEVLQEISTKLDTVATNTSSEKGYLNHKKALDEAFQ